VKVAFISKGNEGAGRRSGFTLIELLVCIGIAGLLVALLAPQVAGVRSAAMGVRSRQNAVQLGLMLTLYAATNRDLPPVFFKPLVQRLNTLEDDQTYTIDGHTVRGGWWFNGDRFFLVFDPPAPERVLMAPGRPLPTRWSADYNGGASSLNADYSLSDSFFADPAYWRYGGDRGPHQWRAQRFGDVLFPSQKGMLWQRTVWHIPRLGPRSERLLRRTGGAHGRSVVRPERIGGTARAAADRDRQPV
jgi:prepilin-type N-terminal cleavage/methylation domain-containing protein